MLAFIIVDLNVCFTCFAW